jgi:hypothetical protein
VNQTSSSSSSPFFFTFVINAVEQYVVMSLSVVLTAAQP